MNIQTSFRPTRFALRNSLRNSSSQPANGSNYCLESVKKHDYENFICTLLLKSSPRSVALAVRSFNVEVSRVAEQITQQNIGAMRFKFWEETLDKCFRQDPTLVPKHPIAVELYKAIAKSKLTKRYFVNLLNSRAENLGRTMFPTLEASEKYAEQSVSNVYYLLLEGCGVRNVHADHAASHLGKAQGLIQQLRTIPIAKRINFLAVPQEILSKHELSHEDVLRGNASDKLCECAFDVASRAHQHLVKARTLVKSVPEEGRCVLLPASAVENYLQRLEKVNHNVLHPSLQKRGFTWLPRLWYRSWKNEF